MTDQFVCESAESLEVDWEYLVQGTDADGRHRSGRSIQGGFVASVIQFSGMT